MGNHTRIDDELFEESFERVSWGKIHAYMIVSNWKWQSCGVPPSIDKLKSHVRNLWYHLDCTRPNTKVGSGGFEILRYTWDDSIEICINFMIEHNSASRRIPDNS